MPAVMHTGKGGIPLKKSERRVALVKYLVENPFATDDQLAEMFHVSVATIRLDRAALHIPEVRERTRLVAAARQDAVRSLSEREVVGDIVELQLNRSASSVMHVTSAQVFSRTGIVRGHYLFAQVNSLATALVDAEVALTVKTELRFYQTVRLGQTVFARADAVGERFGVVKCRVASVCGGQTVLDGWIWVAKAEDERSLATGGDIE
ncbi:transcription factor FapR [Alicyclobacillus cycloheptanicus]|uniref:Acyl-coenzyme A thioesterase PaaI-like protein n=1 Tax=Alicyclobacillus cycloheptanicus TaxID=1457 RepID=A0ABT9XME3_9BACL|nr:transcription factor FapR [Alicyclobacillus cycloheptanicus]MDQ0190861.1 acyl-coenzyme A thioesterase PaaI-like protein [Alicyclobacillus cycloheptanicus]